MTPVKPRSYRLHVPDEDGRPAPATLTYPLARRDSALGPGMRVLDLGCGRVRLEEPIVSGPTQYTKKPLLHDDEPAE